LGIAVKSVGNHGSKGIRCGDGDKRRRSSTISRSRDDGGDSTREGTSGGSSNGKLGGGGARGHSDDTILSARARARDTDNTTNDSGGGAVLAEVGSGYGSVIKTNLVDDVDTVGIVGQPSSALHGSRDTSNVGAVGESSGAGSSDGSETIASAVGVSTREGSAENRGGVGGQQDNTGITESSGSLELSDSGYSTVGEVSISRDEDVGAVEG
jgi:hypothetical protein